MKPVSICLVVLAALSGVSCSHSGTATNPATATSPPLAEPGSTHAVTFPINGPIPAGISALNPKFNSYAAYMKRLSRKVEQEWFQILESMNTSSFAGTHVFIIFRLDSTGKVIRIESIETNAPKAGTDACVKSISNPAPYEAWTPDMVKTVGSETSLAFQFYFE